MEELTLQVLFHKRKSIFSRQFRRSGHSHPSNEASWIHSGESGACVATCATEETLWHKRRNANTTPATA